jgi:hypothetical protein
MVLADGKEAERASGGHLRHELLEFNGPFFPTLHSLISPPRYELT